MIALCGEMQHIDLLVISDVDVCTESDEPFKDSLIPIKSCEMQSAKLFIFTKS